MLPSHSPSTHKPNLAEMSRGFTLIEVLLALVILAISFTALFSALQFNTVTAGKIRQRVVSHWVAEDIFSEVQLGLIPPPDNGQTINGRTTMMRHRWSWDVKTLSKRQDLVNILIAVSQNDTSPAISTLHGYLFTQHSSQPHDHSPQ